MIYKTISRYELFEYINTMKFRNQDIKEAMDFGCKSILECYANADNKYARYFIILDGDKPIAPILLARDGTITFFIAPLHHSKSRRLVKVLRMITKWYTENYETTIFVHTASWYLMARKLVRLVGFKIDTIDDKTIKWVFRKGY